MMCGRRPGQHAPTSLYMPTEGEGEAAGRGRIECREDGKGVHTVPAAGDGASSHSLSRELQHRPNGAELATTKTLLLNLPTQSMNSVIKRAFVHSEQL